MKISDFLPLIVFLITLQVSMSCAGNEKANGLRGSDLQTEIRIVYIVNNNLHTGIVIPINDESTRSVIALRYFKNYSFSDIGWGEEKFYQDPKDNICMGARAIFLPNTSVIRIEGYTAATENFILWSDYTVRLALSTEQYIKLTGFINKSFKMEPADEPVITSKKNSGEIIFFKSVYRYHLFNTCNTWVAKALKYSGLDVSPFFIITAGQLYNEIKDLGTVIKAPE